MFVAGCHIITLPAAVWWETFGDPVVGRPAVERRVHTEQSFTQAAASARTLTKS